MSCSKPGKEPAKCCDKGKRAEECTPEQVKACHGAKCEKHPC